MADHPTEILLVEDNPNDVRLTLRAFKQYDLVKYIDVVRDGAEALEYLFCTGAHTDRRIEDHPKVILLDVKLPKVNGLEVLRQIKADARTRPIPVVMLSSSSVDRDLLESYQLGANSYIVKPVDFDQFNEVARLVGMYWLLLNHRPQS